MSPTLEKKIIHDSLLVLNHRKNISILIDNINYVYSRYEFKEEYEKINNFKYLPDLSE